MLVETYWIEDGVTIRSTLETDSGEETHAKLLPILRLYVEEGTGEHEQGMHLIFAETNERTPLDLAHLIDQQGGRVVIGYAGTSIRIPTNRSS
jgi:hypothetical protein